MTTTEARAREKRPRAVAKFVATGDLNRYDMARINVAISDDPTHCRGCHALIDEGRFRRSS